MIDLELQQFEQLGGDTSGFLDQLSSGISLSGIGATGIVVGDTLWSMSTGKPLVYGYSQITTEGFRGSFLTGSAGKVIKAGGTVLSVAGGVLDSVNAYDSFSQGDTGGTIRYGASSVGSFAGVVFWPAAVGTALGNGTAMGIEYFGRKHGEALDRRGLQESISRRINADVTGGETLQNLQNKWEEYGCGDN
ncbi:hypothetical protein G0Q06_13080 [Puniceicoccales bacterium CK1056]|uniref:Uncharacterized protein n=1 Tax=Oceanipulchritudo coccoides TaxID=2706888 RepID=A0A6B2M581_9BACT|nr:hypothetical protein [Oceanipulchritudo coccoides]NDV63392.1 hypothetical protein [Oceanipulchritudo coccoides]